MNGSKGLVRLLVAASLLAIAMPPAPPRFSMTNCWPKACVSLSDQGRPIRSVAPPGA